MSRLIATLIVLAALSLAGCGGSSKSSEAAQPSAARDVKVVTAQILSSSGDDEIAGTVTARNRAEVATRIQARIESIPVMLGSHVKKGDPLAILDMRDLEAREAQAQAVADQSAQQLKRYEQLLDKKLVSQQEFDGIEAQAKVSAATLEEVKSTLSYARVTAPFSGVVTQKLVDIGDLTVPGSTLFTVEEDANLRLVASIPESDRGRISVGDSLAVSVPSIDTVVIGIVQELSNSADPANRSFEAKVGLPSLPRLRAGQYARLRLPDMNASGLYVPAGAVVQRGQLELVYVASKDGHASLRMIRSGRRTQGLVEIVSGLTPGEQVIVTSPEILSDGELVRVTP